jgi:hypothetical protein
LPARTSTHRSVVSRVAALSRSRSIDDPELTEARRELSAARLEDYIARVVAEAPPLTNAQQERLALLLRGSNPEDGVAA